MEPQRVTRFKFLFLTSYIPIISITEKPLKSLEAKQYECNILIQAADHKLGSLVECRGETFRCGYQHGILTIP